MARRMDTLADDRDLPEAELRIDCRHGRRSLVEIGYSRNNGSRHRQERAGVCTSIPVRVPASTRCRCGRRTRPLPAGATAHRVRTETKIATPVSVVALWPTPTDGARSIEIATTTPDGVVSPLLWIKDFRPDWRSPYVLSSPVSLPAGTRLTMTTYFDNPSDKTSRRTSASVAGSCGEWDGRDG